MKDLLQKAEVLGYTLNHFVQRASMAKLNNTEMTQLCTCRMQGFGAASFMSYFIHGSRLRETLYSLAKHN